MNFLKKTEVSFSNAVNSTFKTVKEKYQQLNEQFTSASPYMQIILVIHNIYQNALLYLEDVLTEFNIVTATKIKSVHGISRLSGHNPARANAAKGTIKIKLKPESIGEIAGSYIILDNYIVIKSKNTKLKYTIDFNKERNIINLDNTKYSYYNIYQGEYQNQTFVGNGSVLQSFNVKPNRNKFIDNSHIAIYVNNVLYPIYEHLYDIPYNTNGCIVKTAISEGIDVYFGNTNFGKIPSEGQLINVVYLETEGVSGNIYNNFEDAIFDVETDARDNLGNTVDINEMFELRLDTSVVFGSNPENSKLTKLIAPMNTRTNVLGNPESYIYFFRKMNIFSHVDAYTLRDDEFLDDDNIIYVFLIPDVKRKLDENNYFKIPTTNFLLNEREKTEINQNIIISKKQIPGSEIKIVNPKVKRFVCNIVLRVFEGYDDTTLRAEIISKMSDYFLEIKRRDKIPRSDLVRIIENVEYVDSVFVEFISAENEISINRGFYIVESIDANGVQQNKVIVEEGGNPQLGIDDYGDITINNGELPIIRGGFKDRNNNYYTEMYEKDKTGPLNIFVNDVIPKDLYSDILNSKLKDL